MEIGQDLHNVGVISFGNFARINIPLYGYYERDHLYAAIDYIPWKDQWTNTSGGIRLMRTQLLAPSQGNRRGFPDVAIIVTDGKSNIDSHLTTYEAMIAKAIGIKLLVVGVTNQVDLRELNGIASDPDDKHVFLASTFEELGHIQMQLVHTLCYGTGTATWPWPLSTLQTEVFRKISGSLKTGCWNCSSSIKSGNHAGTSINFEWL